MPIPLPPIAIIGNGCRLPGGISDASKLWEALLNPKDLVKDVPPNRFRWEGFYRSDGRHNGISAKSGYWLEENIRHFDPQFFGISPSDAHSMDPQQRLLLECVYEAIESAGLTLEGLRESDTGVFVGQMFDDYHELAVCDNDVSNGRMITTGTVRSITANRISHVFDFRGPSIAIDTACSSSMVAVHLAVESLRRGESRVAFACGANLTMVPTVFKAGGKMGMLSPDGRSKMFDNSADGYGRGEGIGVLCLKRLDRAIEDGDIVECVIRQIDTNHDGRGRTLTAPSTEAQARLIRKTYENAGLDLSDPSSRPQYFEAHGTGTRVGDPAEAEAVEKAFFDPEEEHVDDIFMYIGSIKTIVGHTEGTAGIAGILRASLALQHETIPPNLHYNHPDLKVAARGKHLRVPTTPQTWPSLPEHVPRRVSVNSFGFGGTNAHVILESFDNTAILDHISSKTIQSDSTPVYTPFTFSGTSEKVLQSTLETYLGYLRKRQDQASLRDLAWTLQYKRSQFEHRISIAAQNRLDLVNLLIEKIDALRAEPAKDCTRALIRGVNHAKPRIMGIFTGQGAQYATMGKQIIESSSYACDIIDQLDGALATLPAEDRPDWKLRDELVAEANHSRVNEAAICQPLTTAIQILMVYLLEAAGLKMEIVVGHSSGEVAAAFAAGIVSAEDAIRNAYYRGFGSSGVGGSDQQGAMVAASMAPEDAAAFCNLPKFAGRIAVAAVNSPSDVTLSGDADAIKEAGEALHGRGIVTKRLLVEKAYHSSHMLAYSEHYRRSLDQSDATPALSKDNAPTWYSSVSPGTQVTSANADYWVKNMCQPVMFKDAIIAAINKTELPDLVIEIGPRPVLGGAIRRTIAQINGSTPLYTGLLERGTDAVQTVSKALGLIWCHFGREAVDLANLDRTLSNQRLPTLVRNLPTYHWQHDKEYWIHSRYLREQLQSTAPPNELLGSKVHLSGSHEAKWRQFLDPKQSPWMLAHKVRGKAVLPAASYITMAATAIETKYSHRDIASIDITNIHFEESIVFANEYTRIETVFTMHNIKEASDSISACFVIDYCSDQAEGDLVTAARGYFSAQFGDVGYESTDFV